MSSVLYLNIYNKRAFESDPEFDVVWGGGRHTQSHFCAVNCQMKFPIAGYHFGDD